MKILLATRNKGKFKEVKAVLKESNITLLSLLDLEDFTEVIEDQDSFQGNAYKKAKTYFDKYHIPTLADDSGLCVDALDGAPGIHSARFSREAVTDEDNYQLLLEKLKTVESRKAHFHCTLCFVTEQEVQYFEGQLHGLIAQSPRGNHGFGYDPVFFLEEYQTTLAEMEPKKKNEISHRAKALEAFKNYIN
jgi:XTP/dITP diphosphohydrolase